MENESDSKSSFTPNKNQPNSQRKDTQSKMASPIGDSYCDLSDLIISIGMSIMKAQEDLDMTSYRIENEIRTSDLISTYSLNASWFCINDVEVELRIHIIPKKSQSGFKLLVAPVNAALTNLYISD
ncbi:MAG: hypothetical protein U1C51_09330 [Candidatus Izemoplasmatales bacterium]|nr:hypothetical protein [Candidatus Izemoplasmatales bacterium]